MDEFFWAVTIIRYPGFFLFLWILIFMLEFNFSLPSFLHNFYYYQQYRSFFHYSDGDNEVFLPCELVCRQEVMDIVSRSGKFSKKFEGFTG